MPATTIERRKAGIGMLAPQEDMVSSLILKHRIFFLTSPIWVAALLVAAIMFGGRELRTVVEFLTAAR